MAKMVDCENTRDLKIFNPDRELAPVVHEEWIPCSERLPQENGRYLCTFKDIFYGGKNLVDFGLFDDGQWIVEPLAWMPLPQPWEEMDGER